MKVEVLKENIKKGLTTTERVIGKNLSLPILENILIKTEKNFLHLAATDLETAIRWWSLAKIKQQGKVTVPARFLSSFISLLPKKKVLLNSKNKNLSIECQNYKTQIQGNDPEEFPLIPEIKNPESLEINNKKFNKGLSQVVDVVSPSQARPEISGLLFSFQKGNLKIVATDSFRLAEKTISLEKKNKKETSFILPQKPAKEIMNILGDKEGNIKVSFSSNQAMFECSMSETSHPQVQIISKLIEGEYPNYQEIIPDDFKTHITLKKDEFLNHIKAASLFSGKINEIKFGIKPSKNKIEITAQDPDVGKSTSSLKAKIDGKPLEISYNHKFLIDGLSNISSSEVVFDLSKKEGPSVLKPVGDKSYIYVVMPIKDS